ncbi:hypothetical protein BJX65DRAFT_279384 [Aspergillus insuetus]
MPPKRVIPPKPAQARGIPYDLRRTNMPREEPPAPGKKVKRTYMPRKTSQAIAAIRNEAKKQAISTPAALNVVGRKQRAWSSAPAIRPTRARPATSATRSTTPSRSRSRSISRAASAAASVQPPRRVRFSEEPPMASGALQQPVTYSSDQNTSSEEDEESEEQGNEAKEEEDTGVELPPAPPRQPSTPRRMALDISNIGSSDFKKLQEYADEAASTYYNARENYKEAQHVVQVIGARRHYINLRHDGPMTSDAEEALEEAMISADFPLEVSLQLYANKKVNVRKVLGKITRKTFKVEDFKSTVTQPFENACGTIDYTLKQCTATFKHSSGRGDESSRS